MVRSAEARLEGLDEGIRLGDLTMCMHIRVGQHGRDGIWSDEFEPKTRSVRGRGYGVRVVE